MLYNNASDRKVIKHNLLIKELVRRAEQNEEKLLFNGEFEKFCKEYGGAWVELLVEAYDMHDYCSREFPQQTMSFLEFCEYWGVPESFQKRLRKRLPVNF